MSKNISGQRRGRRLMAAAAALRRTDPIRQGHHHVHADGRQRRRRRHACPPDRRGGRRQALGVDKLNAQFSAWAPETMINQFKEAVAAKPTCIEIMGHPGGAAFHDLVKKAPDQGIVVTGGNSPMTDLQKEFGSKGFGYAGVDLYAGGR